MEQRDTRRTVEVGNERLRADFSDWAERETI